MERKSSGSNFGSNKAQTQRTPAAKAIRAALIDASSYVSCLLVPRNNCMARFEANDQHGASAPAAP